MTDEKPEFTWFGHVSVNGGPCQYCGASETNPGDIERCTEAQRESLSHPQEPLFTATPETKCPTCRGSGKEPQRELRAPLYDHAPIPQAPDCKNCDGTGVKK